MPEYPEKPETDPAKHESPQAYAEAWWRYHRDTWRASWWKFEQVASAQTDGTAEYPLVMSHCSGVAHDIEYHGEMAQLFVDVHSSYEDPRFGSDGFAVKSISLGRDLTHYRPITNSNPFARWAEEVKREARSDFLRQCMPLLDADYLLGRK